MKIGDLVKWAGPGYDGPDKGLGSIVDIFEGVLGPKRASANVYWPGWGETQWTTVGRLRVINESR
jgi:hypothetical protein